jgi:hypothetical protein
MVEFLILLLGVLLAVSSVVLVDRVMKRSEPVGRPSRLLCALWIPLLMCVPFLGVFPHPARDGTIGSVAVLAGVPLTMAIALPLVLLSRRGRTDRPWHADDRLPIAWPAVGVVLLVLAVAGRGPHFLAVVVFAIGIVLLWLETIPLPGESHGRQRSGGLALAFASVIGLGLVALAAGQWRAMLLLCMLTAAAMLVSATIRLGLSRAMLVAGWAACLGPVWILGLVGQGGLQASIAAAGGDLPAAGYRQLGGLEVLVVPGLLILALSGFITGWARWPTVRGRLVAVLLAAGGIGLALGLLVP